MPRYYSTIKDLTRLLGGPSHRLDLVGIASAAQPGAAGPPPDELVGIASAAQPGAAGPRPDQLSGAQCSST
jgi:hypothetical protein